MKFRGPQALLDRVESHVPAAENKPVTARAFIHFRGLKALLDNILRKGAGVPSKSQGHQLRQPVVSMMQSTESIVRNNAPGVCGTTPPALHKEVFATSMSKNTLTTYKLCQCLLSGS